MNNKQDIRIGLLGYGAWGRWHAQVIAKTAGASLVAVADAREERRKKAQDDFPIPAYKSYEDLIDLENVDLIDITLPNFLHQDAALKVIEADKHLLLEKPMGLSAEECDTILQLRNDRQAKKRRRKGKVPVLAIGFELRMSSLWRRVKELIDEGAIGTPRSAQMEVFRDLPDLGKGAWRLDRSKAGSWMLDGPIHYFDLLRWYFSSVGNVKSVYSAASSRKKDSFNNSFSSILRYSDGGFASLYYCMGGFGHSITLKISGDSGGITAAWEANEGTSSDPNYRLRIGRDSRISNVRLDGKPGEIFDLEAEIQELVQSIRKNNTPRLAGGHEGKEAVRLCLAAEESLESGESVEL
jgi:myo-inositol 2-dehydrogenase/D-chiro-inositol 1-dehydrogenase